MKKLALCINTLKTENRKQQNTDNIHLLVENCDIKLEILNKLAHLNQLENQISVVRVIFKVFLLAT